MLSTRTRRRLERQGFLGLDDDTIAAIGPGTRFAPALCAIGGAAGTVLASEPILLALAATALVGAIAPRHPFDFLYNHGLRHLFGRPATPANGAPRRFACAVGTVWLIGTTAAFSLGWTIAAYLLGAAFVAVAGLVATTDFCIPSLVYGWTIGPRFGARQLTAAESRGPGG